MSSRRGKLKGQFCHEKRMGDSSGGGGGVGRFLGQGMGNCRLQAGRILEKGEAGVADKFRVSQNVSFTGSALEANRTAARLDSADSEQLETVVGETSSDGPGARRLRLLTGERRRRTGRPIEAEANGAGCARGWGFSARPKTESNRSAVRGSLQLSLAKKIRCPEKEVCGCGVRIKEILVGL